MSKQHTKFPDASGESLKEDKCQAYECSTDSGFVSGEIADSGLIETEFKESNSSYQDTGSAEEQENEEKMLIDSGLVVTDSFYKLSLGGQNDLNSPDKGPTLVESQSTDLKDIPSMFYYTQDEDGDTHLHTAIEEGFVEVALALIRAAPLPELLEIRNNSGQTPLHLAVATGQANVARWLVVAGVDPCPRGFKGHSPFHIAALSNDTKSVQALAHPVQQQEKDQLALSYQVQEYLPCDLDQWNFLGQTCVHVAAIRGHVEVLKHLVWYGADINARQGCTGYTALHYAVEQRDEALVQYLLTCKNIDVDVLTYEGRDVLEVSKDVSESIKMSLRNRGVPSPLPSDDEDDFDSDDEVNGEFDSEDEMYEQNSPSMDSLVGANA
nr:NF-kappa-B inhibitor cactus-like [Leptinotarsa decemlineata]